MENKVVNWSVCCELMINLKYTTQCYYMRWALQQTPKLLLSSTYTATLCRNLDIDEIGFLWFYFMLFMSHKNISYGTAVFCLVCLVCLMQFAVYAQKRKCTATRNGDNEEIALHDESIVYTVIQIMVMMMMWVTSSQCKSFSQYNARQENLVPLKKIKWQS